MVQASSVQVAFGDRAQLLVSFVKVTKEPNLMDGNNGHKIKWTLIQLGSPFANIFGWQIKWFYSIQIIYVFRYDMNDLYRLIV